MSVLVNFLHTTLHLTGPLGTPSEAFHQDAEPSLCVCTHKYANVVYRRTCCRVYVHHMTSKELKCPGGESLGTNSPNSQLYTQ